MRPLPVWLDPQGNSHVGDAYDILENIFIGNAESQKLSLAPGGESLEWKGTGGAEAKALAQSKLSGRKRGDPRNDIDLAGMGWSKVVSASISGLGVWLRK